MHRLKGSLAVLCLATFVAPTYSQTTPTWKTSTYPAQTFDAQKWVPIAVPVDVNNDGVQDVLQLIMLPSGGSAFTVVPANGDGAFLPVAGQYTIDPNLASSQAAVGDFNNDGNADVAFAVQKTNKLVVFFGNGKGSFSAPKNIELSLPGGNAFFTSGTLVAGDFNVDGNLDLVSTIQSDQGEAIVIFPGDGHGDFVAPIEAWGPESDIGPSAQILTGDFNGDGLPDLVFTQFGGGFTGSILDILLGRGDFSFAQTFPLPGFGGNFPFGVGDVNHDGYTDIVGIDNNNNQLDVIDGQKSGDFVINSTSPAPNVFTSSPIVVGDFNGDGNPDLAVSATNTMTNNVFGPPDHLFLFLANGKGGFAEVNQPIANPGYLGNAMVGQFHRDTKPDVAILGEDTGASKASLFALINTTASGNWGTCLFPAMGAGISACVPPAGPASSPFHFRAAASSYGPLRKIELWVDGKKLGEQYNVWENRAWLDVSASLAAGTHHGTFVRNDTDNMLEKQDFTFTLGSGWCPAPSPPGVNVCAPAPSTTNNSPVQVEAAARITGTLARMELWVNGSKVYSENTHHYFQTSVSLAHSQMKYRLDIYAVNTAGTKWEQTVYVYVP